MRGVHDLLALYVSEWQTWLVSCPECGMLARADSRQEGLLAASAAHSQLVAA